MAAIPYLDLSYGTRGKQRPRINRVQLGDGYSTREEDGLNSTPQNWSLIWENIPVATGETLRQFFEGLAGTSIVDWTPPGQSTALKWTAGDFSINPTGHNTVTCSVPLTQEFDL